jgi:integrase
VVSPWFASKARKAGIAGKTAHGLRKTRAIALVDAEATHHQVGAWTGHESLKEIEHYAKKFNRRKALTRSKREQESSKPSDSVPKLALKGS